MSGSQEDPPVATRASFDATIFLLLAFTAALRLRLHATSPLPSQSLAAWLTVGAAEDLAVVGVSAAILMAVPRSGRWDAAARATFSLLAIFLVAGESVWVEILTFFGQIPPLDSLAAGMNPTFIRGSLDAPTLVGVGLPVVLFGASLAWAARRTARARRAWSTPGRLLLASGLALALLLLPIDIHRRDTARNPLTSLVELWLERPATDRVAGYSEPAPPGDPGSVRELAPPRGPSSYPNERFPLAHSPDRTARLQLPEGARPNVVFLLLEGVRAEELGAYGGRVRNLTPNLDRLAREGVLFERAYAPGMHTTDAELAVWYGLLPNPHLDLMTSHPDVRLTGLPEILLGSGYRSLLWIHNGDQTFYRRDRFYLRRGFQMVDGRDFPSSDARTSWGYSDRALARRALYALDRAREPFAALVLTVSNHHPFHVPADARTFVPDLPAPERGFLRFLGLRVGLQTSSMMRTVHYTDEAVGDFFRMGEARPWFGRTVFVVAGDHGLSIAPHERSITTLAGLTELRHRVPMILFSPMIRPARVSTPVSQADVPETVLSLAGIASLRAGLGRDLLAPAGAGDDRRVVTWSSEGNVITIRGDRRTYQAAVARGSIGRSRLFDLEDEAFFDHHADREGTQNLIAGEQNAAETYRRLARVYLEVYPWVLASGRSGVPDYRVRAAGPDD
ncbi:MAG: LTA synthase family protein [Acidobacteriota bacterium]|nr:LTA synthase family protein [Acidobacteriota bacterium]MDQ5871395.1 LTA synthase family protein [Acidobacteriota bacterium]